MKLMRRKANAALNTSVRKVSSKVLEHDSIFYNQVKCVYTMVKFTPLVKSGWRHHACHVYALYLVWTALIITALCWGTVLLPMCLVVNAVLFV